MTQRQYVVVHRWREFQHYSGRKPPWIKNYLSLLANPDYLALSGRHRGLLHGLWMLYAIRDGDVPASPSYIAQQLGMPTEWELRQRRERGESVVRAWRECGEDTVRGRDLKRLEQAGFITILASTETETETEKYKTLAFCLQETQSEGQDFAISDNIRDTINTSLREIG